LPPRRQWQAPEFIPPFDKRNPLSVYRYIRGPFLENLHVTGPESLWPTRVSREGKALREAGLAPRVAKLAEEAEKEDGEGGGGGRGSGAASAVRSTAARPPSSSLSDNKKPSPSPIRVVGASQTYDDFILGFVAWVQANVAPYPQPPAELRSGKLMPALRPEFQSDVDWARSLGRGAFPQVIRGRPARLSPAKTDPLQNGEVARLKPGFAFTAPGNQEKGTAWRAWEAAKAAKEGKLRAAFGGGGGEDEDDEARGGAPWLRALIARFHDPEDL
jgi:hypothetical protein